MKSVKGFLLCCVGAIALAGCAEDSSPDDPDDETEQTGIAVTVDNDQMVEADAVRFDIATCDGEEVVTEERDIAELEFDEDMELDVEGSVEFADYFATVEAGCYDVELTPLDGDGEVVGQCVPATAEQIEVEAGETTEIAMVSQCGGQDQGGLDVLGVLNFAPTITDVQFDPSKVVGCESVQVCATAVDTDGDGIEFEWDQLDGPEPQEGPEVVSSTEDNGIFTECVEMTPGWTASYDFEVTAWDLMHDEESDEMVRVEELVRQEGDDEDFESRASLAFPVHAVCEEPDEDVLGEVEDDEKDKKEYEDDVLDEIEDDDKKDKKDDDQEVLDEIEDDDKKDKKEDDEDVLGEVEDDDKKDEKKDDKKDEDEKEDDEDVLGEVEDDKDEKDDEDKQKKDEYSDDKEDKKDEDEKEDDEEVLGETEEEKADDEKKEKIDPEEVLGEIEKDDPADDKKAEDVLGELDNCTAPRIFWSTFHAEADDQDHRLKWPVDEETTLGEHTWLEVVSTSFNKKQAWSNLAQQYVVARLNIAAGAEVPDEVEQAFDEIDDLLDEDDLWGHDKYRAKDLTLLLYGFNAGEIGPGACPEFDYE